jgi:23S rRNA (uracil1939-C5)-methyltransferase
VSEAVLIVKRIGARGDGIAIHEGRPVYLPLTAPGDVVRARLGADGRGEVVALIERGARQEAPCPHFGTCGGCSLQHLTDDSYRAAKEAFVHDALAHRGIEAEIAPLARIAPGTRRRARLALTKAKDGTVRVGFHRRASHDIVDMETCLVLRPELFALLPALRELAGTILQGGDEASALLTLADTGTDVLLDLPRRPDLAALESLAAFARANDLVRVAWRIGKDQPMPVVQQRPMQIIVAGVKVDLPPDGFLQASAEAENLLRELALDGIGNAERVADLYSGVGTFSFAFAAPTHVHAVDGDKAAIAALQAAARRAGLGARLTAEVRDLEARPLSAEELARFNAVLFDPPFAGAKAQARELARSNVKHIVAVSCNPASFARDTRALIDGGYRLRRVMPIDQFVWSAEIELVAWFERA